MTFFLLRKQIKSEHGMAYIPYFLISLLNNQIISNRFGFRNKVEKKKKHLSIYIDDSEMNRKIETKKDVLENAESSC